MVTHGGDDADLEVEVQVADELLDDRGLLGVLLAEVGAIRPDDVEELQADRGHAAEMPRPELAFQLAAELSDVDPGSVAVRVHLLGRGREEDVDAGLLGELRIALLVARIAVEVLAGRELGRVHEEARDDDVILCPRGLEQRKVASVEGAHCGHEPDRPGAVWQLGDRPDDPHRTASSAVASARVR